MRAEGRGGSLSLEPPPQSVSFLLTRFYGNGNNLLEKSERCMGAFVLLVKTKPEHRATKGKKEWRTQEFAFTSASLRPLPLVRKRVKEEEKGIWGIRGPDWVSNAYSGQRCAALFRSHQAVKGSDNFPAQRDRKERTGGRGKSKQEEADGEALEPALFQSPCWSGAAGSVSSGSSGFPCSLWSFLDFRH